MGNVSHGNAITHGADPLQGGGVDGVLLKKAFYGLKHAPWEERHMAIPFLRDYTLRNVKEWMVSY